MQQDRISEQNSIKYCFQEYNLPTSVPLSWGALNSNEEYLAAACGTNVHFLNRGDLSEIGERFCRHNAQILSMDICPNNGLVCTSGKDKRLCVYDFKKTQLLKMIYPHLHWIASVSWAPSGHLIASGSYDNTIKIIDWKAISQESKCLSGHTDYVTTLKWKEDGAILVSGSRDGTVRLWDVHKSEALQHPFLGYNPCNAGIGYRDVSDGHTHTVTAVTFQDDVVVSSSLDKTVRVWDIKSGGHVKVLTAHNGPVESLSFRMDGNVLASAGGIEKKILFWDVRMWQQLGYSLQHSVSVRNVSWSRSELKKIAVSDVNGHVFLIESVG
eukprot:595712-Hanusia_phi.AAC.4